MLKITEDRKNDISTVLAHLTVSETWPGGMPKHVDTFSCFNGHYRIGEEREFIAKLNEENPGRYSHFHISWCDSN